MATKIKIPNVTLRKYQIPFFKAMDSGLKRAVLVWHRRAGKEIACWNYLIAEAVCDTPGRYCYFFPTSALGRRILWEGINKNGKRFIDYIPKSLIKKTDSSTMTITLMNTSIIEVIGIDKIMNVGTNQKGCVFSEFSLQHPKGWDLIRPILRENKGWAIFNFTPRGKNHAYDMYTMAKNNKKWFCELLTINDTGVLSKVDMDEERAEGMSEDLIQQEYYCSFNQGIDGSYFAKYLQKAYEDGRITNVPTDPYCQVTTVWDLGVSDSTAIIFYQNTGSERHIIDFYQASGEGLDHYARVLDKKAKDNLWTYDHHYAPHDIRVRELGCGAKTRLEMAGQLGIEFEIVPNISIQDGIELTRALWHKLWIDEEKCSYLIKCAENYHRTYNENLNIYSDKPCHDWSSHAIDSLRYMAVIDSKASSGTMTENQADELERLYASKY